MPGPPSRHHRRASTPDDAERRRAEILDASVAVFAADGFEAATVDAIAARARVAKGTVYLYFASKDALYRAALVRGAAEMTALVAARLDGARTARARLEAFVRARLEFFEANRDFFRVYVAEFTNVFSRARRPAAEFDAVFYEQARLLERALASLVREEGLVGTASEVALAVSDLTRGVAIRRAIGRSQRTLDAEVGILTELAWKGLRRR